MKFLKSNTAALFCLITGILLLAVSYMELSSGNDGYIKTTGPEAWYLIIGLALSVSGIVRMLRDKTV